MQTVETTKSTPALQAKQAQEEPFFASADHQRRGATAFFGGKGTGGSSFFNPRPTVQAKLTIGQPGDKYEQEADRMADRVVSQPEVQRQGLTEEEKAKRKPLAAEITPLVQRQPAEEKEPEMMQRKAGAEEPEEELQRKEENPDEEQPGLQTKSATGQAPAPANIQSRIDTTKGGGSPLSAGTRSQMENAFGADFGNVRVHTGSGAAQLNKDLNAQAFTHGSDVYFNEDKYRPESTEGRRLLGHELVHVVQQGGDVSNSIHRKIIVGGKPYVPTPKHKKHLKDNYSDILVKTIEKMHIDAKEYKFDNYEKLGYELRIRHFAMKSMELANKFLDPAVSNECCNYPSAHPNGWLNPTYWKRHGRMDFAADLSGAETPAQAIESVFEPNAGTELECLTMTIAVEYYALLKSLGAARFNKKFAGGVGLIISTQSTSRGGDVVDKEYDNITITGKSDLLPGDWVYFKNFKDYNSLPGSSGTWTGENAIVVGPDKFSGFGLENLSEVDMNQELVDAINRENGLSRTVAGLLRDGGGLQTSPIYRPNIKKIIP